MASKFTPPACARWKCHHPVSACLLVPHVLLALAAVSHYQQISNFSEEIFAKGSDPHSALFWWEKEGSGWDGHPVCWDGPRSSISVSPHVWDSVKAPGLAWALLTSINCVSGRGVRCLPHPWLGKPSSALPTVQFETNSVLKGIISGPNFNLLYVKLPAPLYIWEEPVINGDSRNLQYRGGKCEHPSLLSIGLLVSLDSFCVYCDFDLWMGTSEAIKVILRQTVSN